MGSPVVFVVREVYSMAGSCRLAEPVDVDTDSLLPFTVATPHTSRQYCWCKMAEQYETDQGE